jgi:hypothetical protein
VLRNVNGLLRQAAWRWQGWQAPLAALVFSLALPAAFAALAIASGARDAPSRQTARPSPTAAYVLAPLPSPTPTPVPSPVPTPTPPPVVPTPEPPPPPPEPAPEPPPPEPVAAAAAVPTPAPKPCGSGARPLAWAWQFPTDGPKEEIAAALAGHGMGLILKTHNGIDWMSAHDSTPDAVSGPDQVRLLANYFESQGVPFHAYAVVQGLDPKREARMAAAVLAAGARSIYIDLEPWSGYWQGTPEAAVVFGRELRRLAPEGRVVLAVEPRPWALKKLSLAEFASFSDAIAPLVYWESFNTEPNVNLFTSYDLPPGDAGVTPEFLLDVSAQLFQPYGLPIEPVGQGASPDTDAWRRFLDSAAALGMPDFSVWRHGVTDPAVRALLKGLTPAGFTYVVQPGDTLGAIAARSGATIEAIATANRLPDPNSIAAGQQLCIPTG